MIDLLSLEGITVFDKLLNYYRIYADLSKKHHITSPDILPVEPQRGQTCKLKALADAMGHTSFKYKQPLKFLYKERTYPHSLRELAKKHGSVVGEVYCIEMLHKICADAGFESKVYEPFNEDAYILQLQELIDNNLAPIVFFDMDLSDERRGLPYIGDGKNEHASVVVGYYKNQCDETRFIVTQWNCYYDFDGMELALSTRHSLKEQRKPETFCKTYNETIAQTEWRLDSEINAPEISLLVGTPKRTALAMHDTDTALKGKIFVLTQPRPILGSAQSGFFPQQPKEKNMEEALQLHSMYL